MSLSRISLVLFILMVAPFSHAKLIQIIHTNDLHSYFEGYKDGRGGYAKLMTKIKELRSESQSKGVEVLQLDGGDWGEGTSFFLSDRGNETLKALEMLGTDVATIGNHDTQLGGQNLGAQLRRANIKTKFVLANLVQTPDMELGNTISPYVDINRAGISIRVIGLTTSESFFQYAVKPGKVLYPNPVGEEQGKLAKKEGKELVIALTHIGKYQDESLAQNSSSIDVIIGGHSHSKITEVDYETNTLGKKVPVVQAWAHGLAVGTLLLDVTESGVEVVEYKLHEVTPETSEDLEMQKLVNRAKENRNEYLKFPWDEVIGETKVPMTGYKEGQPVRRASCWGYHMATAARKAVGASVGIHASSFEGMYKAPGPVTYADIADNFPHIRKYGDQGWEIATVYMSGWKLRPFMYWISRRGYGLTFSGLGYGWLTSLKSLESVDIDEKATYRIAFPAEVALAIKSSFPGYMKYLQGLKYTGKYYWPVLKDYIQENSPISCD